MTTPTHSRHVTLGLVTAASRVLAQLQPLQAAAASQQGAGLMAALANLDTPALATDLATLLKIRPDAVLAMPLPQLITELAGFVQQLPGYLASIEQTGPALDTLTQALQGVASELPAALATADKA